MVKSNKGEIVFVSLLGLLMVFLVIWYHLSDDKPKSTDISPKPEYVLDSTASMLPNSSREFLYPNSMRIPVDTRSLIPVISVHSVSNLQYRRQS